MQQSLYREASNLDTLVEPPNRCCEILHSQVGVGTR